MTAPAAVPPRVVLPFVIVTLIWGSTWIVVRDQAASVPTGWAVCYRFLVAAAAMFAFARWSGAPARIGREGMAFAAGVGVLQFFLNFLCVYQAERSVTSGVVAMIYALLIVPNMLLSWLLLGHRVSRLFLVGTAISIMGMALLFSHELADAALGDAKVLVGIGLALLGVLAASGSNVMQASARGRVLPPVPAMAWAMLIGASCSAIFALVTAGPPTIDPRPTFLLGTLYLGLFGSAVTYPLYFFVIRQIGPAKAAYSGVLIPIIAMAISTVVEDYRWSTTAVAGAALALGGLLVAIRSR
jgi:drug/metabolite transporter (DMT)-like permease